MVIIIVLIMCNSFGIILVKMCNIGNMSVNLDIYPINTCPPVDQVDPFIFGYHTRLSGISLKASNNDHTK